MVKPTVLSRKIFLRLLTGLSAGLFLWIWYRLGADQVEKESLQEFRHGEDIPLGMSYFDKYYLFRIEDSVIAYSTICTHAGCRIGKTSGDVLQCGCHGSCFEAATGNPMKGPAIRPLEKLDCRFDSSNGVWIVKWPKSSDSHV